MPFSQIKHFLVPQEGVFFDKLEKQADYTQRAACALLDLLEDYDEVEFKAGNIKKIEIEADDAVHELYKELNKAFIVPIDHSDISGLATALDDILDRATVAAKCLALYEVKRPSEEMKALAQILCRQTKEIRAAMSLIKEHKNYEKAALSCIEIHRLENEADDVYAKAVAGLFKKKDAVEILKQKEILESIEAAIDKGEYAANLISEVLMKHS